MTSTPSTRTVGDGKSPTCSATSTDNPSSRRQSATTSRAPGAFAQSADSNSSTLSATLPQFVHDHDDWSYSRFGLNGLTAGLRANWANWCGADVRSDTMNLSVDVRCALAAYHRMGWAPWS